MPQTFLVSNRVQFRDTDAAGIMHFSAFITYMEQAEHAFLRSLDMSVMKFRIDQMEISWPRVSVQCDYVAPLRFEQEFTVSLTIEKLGRKSVRYGFQFSSSETTVGLHLVEQILSLSDTKFAGEFFDPR